MNDDLLDLKMIATILEHKEELNINPFRAIPEESIRTALSLLEVHTEELKQD